MSAVENILRVRGVKNKVMKIIHAIKTIGRLIISAIFLSFIGFAFSGSWYFWNCDFFDYI